MKTMQAKNERMTIRLLAKQATHAPTLVFFFHAPNALMRIFGTFDGGLAIPDTVLLWRMLSTSRTSATTTTTTRATTMIQITVSIFYCGARKKKSRFPLAQSKHFLFAFFQTNKNGGVMGDEWQRHTVRAWPMTKVPMATLEQGDEEYKLYENSFIHVIAEETKFRFFPTTPEEFRVRQLTFRDQPLYNFRKKETYSKSEVIQMVIAIMQYVSYCTNQKEFIFRLQTSEPNHTLILRSSFHPNYPRGFFLPKITLKIIDESD